MKETSTSIQGKDNIPIEWLPILAYHKIGTQKELGITWIAPSVFEKQIAFLHSEQYQTVSPNDLTEALLEKRKLPEKSVMITFDDGYRNNFEIAAPLLFELKIPFSVFVITDFIKQANKKFMNESMLKELASHPLVSIGSHSQTHVRLTKCSPKELTNEISGSKSYLEDLLGKEIDMFSYPHGDFNAIVRSEVSKAGYKLGFTSHYDVNKKTQDKLKLNRNEIWNTDDLSTLKKKLQGNFDWLKYRSL